jgi:hypothetical protein
MEFEFDKEIDTLLRQAAQGGDVRAKSAGTHLDADEINAFAVNLLPENLRLRAVNHFADCSRCRKILSNLSTFNAGQESEIVHTEEKITPAAIEIPWYKKLFAFPQIAYAMGALALIFGGIIAVIVFKDSAQNYSSDLAQANEQFESPNVFSGSAANSNANFSSSAAANYSNSAPMSNSASSANLNSPIALPTSQPKANQSVTMANSTVKENGVETAKPAPKPSEKTNDNADNSIKKKDDAPVIAAAPPAVSRSENNYTQDQTVTAESDAAKRQSDLSQNQVSRNQTQITPDSRSVQNLPMTARRVERKSEEEATGGASANNKTAETKSLGGKNFRRADGVWYDVNYRNQPTTNVRRNSNEYKKLDANLRSIADKLGGVVVIVSGGKAYRIQ